MSRAADWFDRALEWSVVGSFTRIGAAARRRLDHWERVDGRSLEGRVIVVTGATSGLGLEAARTFARMGANVAIVGRDAAKTRATAEALRREGAAITEVVADMGDLDAVRRAATELLHQHPEIHVLIHNAGALDDTWQPSPQGIERTVASHVVGPFLLTERLLPALERAAPSRVIWVSSGGMYGEPLRVDALEMGPDDYDGTKAYARAKRAQVTLASIAAEELAPRGIAVHAMHPGWADTPGVARSLPTFRAVVGPLLRTPAEGADTLIWLAVDDAGAHATPEAFWLDRRPRPLHRLASTRRSDTPEERERLLRWAVEKSGRDR